MAPRVALWLGPGVALLAWAADFSVMYALVTFSCARQLLGWSATVACAAITLAVLLRAIRAAPERRDGDAELETRRLAREVAIVTALLALIAILWHGVAVLTLPGC